MKTQTLYVTVDGKRSLCMDNDYNLVLSIDGKITHLQNPTIHETKKLIKDLSDYDKRNR